MVSTQSGCANACCNAGSKGTKRRDNLDMGWVLLDIQQWLGENCWAGAFGVEQGNQDYYLDLKDVIRLTEFSALLLAPRISRSTWDLARAEYVLARAKLEMPSWRNYRLYTFEGLLAYRAEDRGKDCYGSISKNISTEMMERGIALYMQQGPCYSNKGYRSCPIIWSTIGQQLTIGCVTAEH